MAAKILFAPRQPEVILDIARSLTPAAFELVVADPGTPEFYQAAADAEYYLGLARQMGGEFFRAAPNLRLVQLLSAGDRKSTRLNSSHLVISYAVFCLKKKRAEPRSSPPPHHRRRHNAHDRRRPDQRHAGTGRYPPGQRRSHRAGRGRRRPHPHLRRLAQGHRTGGLGAASDQTRDRVRARRAGPAPYRAREDRKSVV